MRHDQFVIGETFRCGDRQWRCTDIGTRTIVAIRIGEVDVASALSAVRPRPLDHAGAEADGWFNGPPYAVAETVFDENDQDGCQPTNEATA